MGTDTEDLDERLEGLRADSDLVQQRLKITNAEERRFYAAAYVWWREASQKPDYLPQVYAAAGIKHNATRNRINWRPLLKIVSNNTIAKTDLDTWSKAFVKIHDDVTGDPAHYANDPVGQIDYFIKSNGGKTGLAGYHAKKPDELDDEDDDSDDAETFAELEYTLDDDEFEPVFLAEAKQYYSQSPAQALTAKTPAHLTADKFGLAILRGDAAGPAVVTTSNLQPLVDTVVRESYRADFTALPPSTRGILEPLHIANVPLAIAKNIDRFTEYYMGQIEAVSKEKLKASKRLIYRPLSDDFLLSLSNVSTSVCVVAKPHKAILSSPSGDLLLPAHIRRSIEVRLLHQRMFNMFAPAEDDAIPPTPFSSVTACSLPVNIKRSLIEYIETRDISEARALKSIRNLRHPPLAFVPLSPSNRKQRQAQFNPKSFKPIWSVTVTADWLRNAVVRFFDEWIVKYGVKSNRAMNKILSVTLDKSAMCIGYEFGKELGFDTAHDIQFAKGASKGSAALITRSADFAFVLRQIADLPIVGDIELAASKDAVSIQFSTSVAAYSVFIPAADEAGKRSTACFSFYDAVITEPSEDYDADEAEGSSL